MSCTKIIIYIIIILILLYSTLYYIKLDKSIIDCPFKINKKCNNSEWDLEDEIKKFTNIEDSYIKNKK